MIPQDRIDDQTQPGWPVGDPSRLFGFWPKTIYREAGFYMFERFTERARQIIVLAQEEAKHAKSAEIQIVHVLAGVIREEAGAGARALASMTVNPLTVFGLLPDDGVEHEAGSQIRFSPSAKGVLELALREALSLGHNYIGTEHILLAITRSKEAEAIWSDLSVDPLQVRDMVFKIISPPGARRTRPQEASEQAPSHEYDLDGVQVASEDPVEEIIYHASKAARAGLRWLDAKLDSLVKDEPRG